MKQTWDLIFGARSNGQELNASECTDRDGFMRQVLAVEERVRMYHRRISASLCFHLMMHGAQERVVTAEVIDNDVSFLRG